MGGEEGNAGLVKKLETVQMAAAEKTLRCSKTTSISALTAELEMYPLETDKGELRWQYNVKNTHRKEIASNR